MPVLKSGFTWCCRFLGRESTHLSVDHSPLEHLHGILSPTFASHSSGDTFRPFSCFVREVDPASPALQAEQVQPLPHFF